MLVQHEVTPGTRHLVRARLDGPRAHPSRPSDDRKQCRIAFKRRRVAKTSCGEAVGVLGTKSMLAKARGRAPPSPKARPACPQRPSCREFGLETGGAMRSAVRTPPCEQGTRGMSRGRVNSLVAYFRIEQRRAQSLSLHRAFVLTQKSRCRPRASFRKKGRCGSRVGPLPLSMRKLLGTINRCSQRSARGAGPARVKPYLSRSINSPAEGMVVEIHSHPTGATWTRNTGRETRQRRQPQGPKSLCDAQHAHRLEVARPAYPISNPA